MDKTSIKTFAVESRRKMIESVKYQASLLGITADEIREPIAKAEGMETYDYGAGQYTIYDDDIKKRESLVKEIKNKGFDNVVEEVAYTWFNRIIAIRYMEVNDYLPTRTRVLSADRESKIEPDIITEALDIDLNFSQEDKEKIFKFKEESRLDELFRFLFVKQCNKLNEILPGLFEKTDDYMELLLDIKFTDENGVIRQLVDNIPEDDFGNQIEIIGWLYQYYNSELKDDTFKNIKNKVPKERIPAATQLFTPDWIVKYMVENSVGRLWLEGHPNDDLKSKWKYFVEEAEQEPEVELKLAEIRKESKDLKPEDIKVIDPCMGSGHILVYVFEVLMQIYISEGFTEKDAVESILKNNIFGLDIDDRAFQLAYFAIMMKARKYHRTILNKFIVPNVYSIKETDFLSDDLIRKISKNNKLIFDDLSYLKRKFVDAKNYGSLLKIKNINFELFNEYLDEIISSNNANLDDYSLKKGVYLLKTILKQAEVLYDQYDVAITNPPYMLRRNMNKDLNKFISSNFLSAGDFYTAFIERCFDFTKVRGFNSLLTTESWMFLSTFNELREFLLNNKALINLLHMDISLISFSTSAAIWRNCNLNYKSDFKYLNNNDLKDDEPIIFPAINNRNNQLDYFLFKDLPNYIFAYWCPPHLLNLFSKETIADFFELDSGIKCGNNTLFLRYWYEVDYTKIGQDMKSYDEIFTKQKKWFKHNKAGGFKKWYGNMDYVINLENGGEEIKQKVDKGSVRLRNPKNYFKSSISWPLIGDDKYSCKFVESGILNDVTANAIYFENDIDYYLLGFLNSSVANFIINLINPTISYPLTTIKSIPFIKSGKFFEENLDGCVKTNIDLSKKLWDLNEFSWDFKKHYFLFSENSSLEESFIQSLDLISKIKDNIKSNDIFLNNFFIDLYEMDNYVSSSPLSDNIEWSYEQLVISFISYAVGCMFGRYSLDDDGLQFAGGEFDISKYSKFVPDDDNIIPVLDTEYFNDDIVGGFVEFVKTCFGEETLEENLDFIAGALKKKGKTSREIIRNYFLTDFFKDHAQTYKKCPIYWQFDSGKQNAFKCLIYMHRYEPGLVARVRTDYLHKTQKAIEQNLSHCESIIANSSNKSEVSKATKDKSKYIKQLDEIKVYDEALAHIANQRIEMDLDDGVKVNHAKFQNVEISKEGQKVKKINLLKKI